MAHISQVSIGTGLYYVYGDEAEFKTYMAGRLGAEAYDEASGTDRKKAQVQATRWIDREDWLGLPTDPGVQPLAFPRVGLSDCDGQSVSSVVAPEAIIEASFELALILLEDGGTSTENSTTGTNVKEVGAGTAKVKFFRGGNPNGSGGQGTIFPTEAQKLVRCFLESKGISGVVASGTSQPSSFCEDDFKLNEGIA